MGGGGEGADKVLAMLKGGGGTKRFGIVIAQELEVLAILNCKKFQTRHFPNL